MKIVLMGYMGSGKSFLGKKLAKTLNYNYIDLDEYIVKEEGKSISELFKENGEIYFRKIETSHLENVLKKNDAAVIALGGGTPCYGTNLKLISNDKAIVSIYLKASINTLVDRLYPEKDKRPLISHLNSKAQLVEFIGKHLFERTYYYEQATFTINVDTKSPQEIIENIVLQLI
ncbi:MAG: shikimate kinase [Winogradskyella sp.]|nr:shikimate kinase [Winogradskyella sp.]MBT8375932.1 shikimate kinase [Bacteroidia bacterium]NNC45469.1 shikimate kinase [Winogradskyella sp.]NNF85225.1 shikimate kinase [Winogradskyella sp.]NNK39880.1 shikimate kinase [Winogradskyella sp.]